MYEVGEGVVCTVSGTWVSTIQHYTYLAMPMIADLDLNAIMQDKKVRITNAYNEMRPFLTRIDILAAIRSHIRRNVQDPIAICRCELYEMSST